MHDKLVALAVEYRTLIINTLGLAAACLIAVADNGAVYRAQQASAIRALKRLRRLGFKF